VPGIAAIILAAGGSTRMGTRKQLLMYKGQSLLRRAAEAAVGAGCSPVVAVLGCEAEQMIPELSHLPVPAVLNANWERGIGSSIREGVTRILDLSPGVGAILITLADQPLITAATLERMIRYFEESGLPVCASSYSSTVGPPVIVSSEFFGDLLSLDDASGAKEIWRANPDSVALHPCEEGGYDVDTPADFDLLGTV
jgi:molybdenum cofactor cytidylyltransferase